MIVAVQKELMGIKPQLEKRGYTVVEFGKYRASIDALVYDHAGLSLSSLIDGDIHSRTHNGSHMESNTFKGSCDNDHGFLLIHSDGKSIEDILHILQKRVYSPLFS